MLVVVVLFFVLFCLLFFVRCWVPAVDVTVQHCLCRFLFCSCRFVILGVMAGGAGSGVRSVGRSTAKSMESASCEGGTIRTTLTE